MTRKIKTELYAFTKMNGKLHVLMFDYSNEKEVFFKYLDVNETVDDCVISSTNNILEIDQQQLFMHQLIDDNYLDNQDVIFRYSVFVCNNDINYEELNSSEASFVSLDEASDIAKELSCVYTLNR